MEYGEELEMFSIDGSQNISNLSQWPLLTEMECHCAKGAGL